MASAFAFAFAFLAAYVASAAESTEIGS